MASLLVDKFEVSVVADRYVVRRGHRIEGDTYLPSVEDYLVESDSQSKGDRTYDPFRDARGLFLEFSKTPLTPDAVCSFANRRGLICSWWLWPVAPEEDPGDDIGYGTSLKHWYFEIVALRHVVRIWQLCRARDAKSLAQYIQWRETADDNGNKETTVELVRPLEEQFSPGTLHKVVRFGGVIASRYTYGDLFAGMTFGDVFKPAHLHLRQVIDSYLAMYTVPVMQVSPHSSSMQLRIMPKNLLGAMWLQFALAVDGNKQYRQCVAPGCLHWVELTGMNVDSPRVYCSNTCKVRSYRQRKEDAIRLHQEGKTIAMIARELDVDKDSVKSWIRPKGK